MRVFLCAQCRNSNHNSGDDEAPEDNAADEQGRRGARAEFRHGVGAPAKPFIEVERRKGCADDPGDQPSQQEKEHKGDNEGKNAG